MVAKKKKKERERTSFLDHTHAKQMPNKAELQHGVITAARLVKGRLSGSVVNTSSRADTKQTVQFRLD